MPLRQWFRFLDYVPRSETAESCSQINVGKTQAHIESQGSQTSPAPGTERIRVFLAHHRLDLLMQDVAGCVCTFTVQQRYSPSAAIKGPRWSVSWQRQKCVREDDCTTLCEGQPLHKAPKLEPLAFSFFSSLMQFLIRMLSRNWVRLVPTHHGLRTLSS